MLYYFQNIQILCVLQLRTTCACVDNAKMNIVYHGITILFFYQSQNNVRFLKSSIIVTPYLISKCRPSKIDPCDTFLHYQGTASACSAGNDVFQELVRQLYATPFPCSGEVRLGPCHTAVVRHKKKKYHSFYRMKIWLVELTFNVAKFNKAHKLFVVAQLVIQTEVCMIGMQQVNFLGSQPEC